ncbi:tRNA (guanosine(46)-N7)-methyltransferase TrmB [Psittacicella melopsittaci]|uniref:tRNA (guanine-N(7)-)-methyltransferase n=1 Tax=Psittacicella melopsittaci TaxID=2028576 RepID=A0A3A1XZP8_9GAMM|nr:tRNA (guanosine(46)-N7)-methyltransferase TrmB [Psittacicella melopsittaci]RIY31512.1 tRNA (guanosine(46)-N7)-methyltransferase TrmB [Psittacicella melopsittaci]
MTEENLNPQHRRIKSYVLRTGRITGSQEHALENYFPLYGVECPAPGQSLELKSLYPQEQPLIVEIGFGMGTSLVSMAQANPHLNYLGIEVHTPGVGNALKLIAQEQLKNIKVACHDAIEIMQALPENSIAGLQLFFPDPWHKARHHKRRIVNAQFMELVTRALVPGGFIHMATDWENYAEHMLEVLNATPNLENTASDGLYIPRPDSRPLTKFEQRGHRLGHGVWDLYFIKK